MSSSGIIHDVETGPASAISDHAQGNPTARPKSTRLTKLLDSIVNADKEGVGPAQELQNDRQKPRIQKVPCTMPEIKNNNKYLHPQVVSLGPYHHGKSQQFMQMEECKIKAARQFLNLESREDVHRFYDAVADDITEARGSYVFTDQETAALSDENFTLMMFLDGCFILHLIQATNADENTAISLVVSNRLIPQIVRDMFMLENQVPFVVLHALMGKKFKKGAEEGIDQICEFINEKMFVSYPRHSFPFDEIRALFSRFWRIRGYSELFDDKENRPLHLLDMLRTMLLGIPSSERVRKEKYSLHHLGSVMELKQVGIKFGNSHSSKLITGIKLEKEFFFLPRLLLPPMFIDDTSISQMLNLIAFEMCPDNHSHRSVTAYISFLDSLINDADDVKELRSKGILDHRLGSDELVASLFNEWPIEGLSDNLQAYEEVKQRIGNYRRTRVRIRIGEWLYTYFRRPWIAISLVVAILLLFFTCVQTYLAAFPKH